MSPSKRLGGRASSALDSLSLLGTDKSASSLFYVMIRRSERVGGTGALAYRGTTKSNLKKGMRGRYETRAVDDFS